MNNAYNGVQTGIDAITSTLENNNNKNSHSKGFNHITNKWGTSGIHRMSSETEKNTLINKIRGLGSPPFITGRVTSHKCTHMQWRCLDCSHTWDSKDMPPTLCPSCSNSNPKTIISDAKPCVIEESYEV